MSFKKSQLNSFKYASEQTRKPIDDFYNAKTGAIKKPFKDFVKANPDLCKPIVQTVIKACEPLYDQLIGEKIIATEFGKRCLAEKEKIRERGVCYSQRKGMRQPKGLKEYRLKQERMKEEMRKAGLLD